MRKEIYLARLTQHLPQDDLRPRLALVLDLPALGVLKAQVDGIDHHLGDLNLCCVAVHPHVSHLHTSGLLRVMQAEKICAVASCIPKLRSIAGR